MGLHGSWTAELVLQGVRVPAANRLGDEGIGFTVAMSALDSGRVGISAQAVGIAQGALDAAVAASRSRRDAGVDVDTTALADMEVRTAASRQLTRYAASLVDAGERVTLDASIAKLYSTDTCVAVAQAAVDLCAPESGVDDHPAAVRFRDAKACQIYEGTNQIQRVVIARQLLKRMTRPFAGLVASDAWTFASTKSRSRSVTRCVTSRARRSHRAPPTSIEPASSHGTSSICIASTTCSRCRFRPSTAVSPGAH